MSNDPGQKTHVQIGRSSASQVESVIERKQIQEEGMKSGMERARGYRWYVYAAALVLVALQFLQLPRASVFLDDDFNLLISYSRQPFSIGEYLSSFRTSNAPTGVIHYEMLTLFDDPVATHLYIVTVMAVGIIALIYTLSVLGVDWLLSLIAINVWVSMRFNAQPLYFISGSWVNSVWAPTMLSMAAFVTGLITRSSWKRYGCYFTALVFFYIGATIAPDCVLLPFAFLFLPFVLPAERSETPSGRVPTEAGSLGSCLKRRIVEAKRPLSEASIFFLLTTTTFLVRRSIMGVRNHYYDIGWVNHSPLHMIRQVASFGENLIDSFEFSGLRNFTELKPDFFIAGALTAGFYLGVAGRRSVKAYSRSVCPNPLPLALLFLICSGLVLLPTTIIIHVQDRYHYSPSVFFILAFVLGVTGTILPWSRRRGWEISAAALLCLVFVTLILLASSNRHQRIETRYVSHAQNYAGFREAVNRDIPIGDLPRQTQLLLVDHPAARLCQSFNHWSAGMIQLATGREDLTGVVIMAASESDLFSGQIWVRRNGRAFRRRGVALRKDLPLRVYFYRQGSFVPISHLIVPEGDGASLYGVSAGGPPEQIRSGSNVAELRAELSQQGVPEQAVWASKPYPDDSPYRAD